MNRQEMIDYVQHIRQDEQPVLSPPATSASHTLTYRVPTSVGEMTVFAHRPLSVDTPLPGFISFHGGGFITGTPNMDAAWNLYLAEQASCCVLNVTYPLAPEHPFPTPVHVAYDIIRWIVEHADDLRLDASRLAIGGHSAGGNLAAALTLLNRDHVQPIPIIAQVLDYPPLDLVTDPGDKPFFEEAIPVEQARQFNAMYLAQPEDANNPLASPLYALTTRGLPPALVITAGHDSLAREGRDYVKRLQSEGVAVEHHEFPGQPHAFTHHGDREIALKAWQRIATYLRRTFHSS